jgi:hypothetical protein
VDFHTTVTSSGAGVRLAPSDRDPQRAQIQVGFGTGMNSAASWQATYRAADDESTVTRSDAPPLRTTTPLFDPTWRGAYDWMRYGLQGAPPSPSTATSAPSAAPEALPVPAIGRVVALGTGAYRVSDAGEAPCPGGTAGRRLHLVPWRDPAAHPLTDVIVDAQSMRFCWMRFNYGQTGALAMTGSFELRLGPVADYWAVTSGSAEFTLRMLGIGTKHIHLTFAYDDLRFSPPAAAQ